jgi:hypothetical protein
MGVALSLGLVAAAPCGPGVRPARSFAGVGLAQAQAEGEAKRDLAVDSVQINRIDVWAGSFGDCSGWQRGGALSIAITVRVRNTGIETWRQSGLLSVSLAEVWDRASPRADDRCIRGESLVVPLPTYLASGGTREIPVQLTARERFVRGEDGPEVQPRVPLGRAGVWHLLSAQIRYTLPDENRDNDTYAMLVKYDERGRILETRVTRCGSRQ